MYSLGSMIGNNVSVKAPVSATKLLKSIITKQLQQERETILTLHNNDIRNLQELVRKGWYIAENLNNTIFRVLAPTGLYGKIVILDRNAIVVKSYQRSVMVLLGDLWEKKTRAGKVLIFAHMVKPVQLSTKTITVKVLKNPKTSKMLAFYRDKIVRFLGTVPEPGTNVECKVFGSYKRNLYVVV